MEITPLFLGLVPVVMILVEVTKNFIESKWSPIAALVYGILGAAAIGYSVVAIPVIILQGIMVGAMAAGLYSGSKAVSR